MDSRRRPLAKGVVLEPAGEVRRPGAGVSRLEVPFHFRARSQIGELEVGLDRDPTQPPLVLPAELEEQVGEASVGGGFCWVGRTGFRALATGL